MKIIQKTRQQMNATRKFEKELKECMNCRYFWGNDSGCINSKCYSEKEKNEYEQRRSNWN